MKNAASLQLALSAVAITSSAPVFAQSPVRGQGVADRSRPDYDPYGYTAGPFTLYPAVTTSAEATDNYLATDTNRRSDAYALIAPEVRVASNWARHSLTARVFFDQSIHANLNGQNQTQYGGALGGAYDVSRATRITADGSYGRYVENRADLGSFQGNLAPVTYDALRAQIGVAQSFNKLTLNGSFGVNDLNFRDTLSSTGATIDQDFRDVRSITGSLSAQYDIGPGIRLIGTGQYDRSTYSFRPGRPGFNPLVDIDRTSYGFTLQGGVAFELSSLVFGSVQFGVLTRNYRDARLRNFSGLSYSANILWNATSLTSFRLTAQRAVEDASSAVVAGNTRSTLRLTVDHELYRYVLLSGNVGYGSFSPNGPGIGGKEFSAGAGARYLIDRRWSLSANVRYAQRTSASSFLRYRATTASISVRFAI